MGVSPMCVITSHSLSGYAGVGLVGPVHDHALDGLVELQVLAQRRILQRLQLVVHGRLAVIVAVGDVLEEQIHFLVGDDVADVLRVAAQLAEREADHLVAGDRGAAAVAGIDRRVDLDAQPRHRIVVRRRTRCATRCPW